MKRLVKPVKFEENLNAEAYCESFGGCGQDCNTETCGCNVEDGRCTNFTNDIEQDDILF